MRKSLFILICLVEKPLFGLVWRLYNFSSFGLEMCNASRVAKKTVTCASHRLQTNGGIWTKVATFLWHTLHRKQLHSFSPCKRIPLSLYYNPKECDGVHFRDHKEFGNRRLCNLHFLSQIPYQQRLIQIYHMESIFSFSWKKWKSETLVCWL